MLIDTWQHKRKTHLCKVTEQMGSSICSDQGTNVLTKQFLPCFDKSIHPIRSSSALFFWTVGHFFFFFAGRDEDANLFSARSVL